MPVRRKASLRRVSAGMDAWETVLECGFDYFDDLPDAGVDTDAYGRPDRAEAAAAWQEFGAVIMARWQTEASTQERRPWAFDEFGPPNRKRRVGSR